MTTATRQFIGLKVASATVIEANRFVMVDTANDGSAVRAGNADNAIGVASTATANGETASISVATLKSGKLEATSGAAVTRGSAIMSDSQGRAVNRTSTNPILGYALNATTAAGQTVQFVPVDNG